MLPEAGDKAPEGLLASVVHSTPSPHDDPDNTAEKMQPLVVETIQVLRDAGYSPTKKVGYPRSDRVARSSPLALAKERGLSDEVIAALE